MARLCAVVGALHVASVRPLAPQTSLKQAVPWLQLKQRDRFVIGELCRQEREYHSLPLPSSSSSSSHLFLLYPSSSSSSSASISFLSFLLCKQIYNIFRKNILCCVYFIFNLLWLLQLRKLRQKDFMEDSRWVPWLQRACDPDISNLVLAAESLWLLLVFDRGWWQALLSSLLSPIFHTQANNKLTWARSLYYRLTAGTNEQKHMFVPLLGLWSLAWPLPKPRPWHISPEPEFILVYSFLPHCLRYRKKGELLVLT